MSEVKVYKMMSPCISQHIDSYYQETRIVIYQKGFDAHFSGEGIVDMVEKSDFDALAKKLKEHEEKGLLIYGRKIELLNETNRKLSEENEEVGLLRAKLMGAVCFIKTRVICQCQTTLQDVKEKYPSLVCEKCQMIRFLTHQERE